MKKILLSISMLALAYSASANVPVIKSDPKIEAQVEQTLKKLTLEVKIGQMMELVTDLFGANDKNGVFYIDEHKTDSILSRYKIGSILNAPNTCAPTAKQWEKYISQIQKISMKRIGIPCVFGLDQNHGSTYTQDGTLFPQNINVAATFNREIARRSAEATAYETRAVSVPWTYSPTVDLGRDARWPRIWENFGEDCYLSSEMGKAMVYGFQGEDPNNIDQYHIATSMKHFMGYGVPWTGKDRTPAYISPADLREKHFAPFLAGLQAGALTVMVNSASVNGMPMHANKDILTGWLKEETGWDGVLITDWADINNLYTREMVAKDKKDALRIAINAGIDMIMEPYSCDACGYLIELVKEGKIPMSRIDEFAGKYNTIYEAFCNEYGKENVILNQGVTYNETGKYWEENEPQIQGAVDAAKNADVIVACIGENSYTETLGNLTDLWLSENQRNLVKELAKTGKPVVLVLNEGRPRLIADIEPLAQGIIDILIPGNMGGDALVGLVSGKSNFSGKMPYTYPKEINSLANYDFKKSEEVSTMEGAYDYNAKITQQWGFGHGLSYTSYQYSNLKVSKSDFRHGDIIKVSVDVKNSGKVAGKESVLLFSSDLVASMVPDGRRLRAFDKIELLPGETKTVTFNLKADDLAFVGYDGKWVLEEGDFKLMIADQSADIHCEKTYQWQSANR